jgi:hypothetical protein
MRCAIHQCDPKRIIRSIPVFLGDIGDLNKRFATQQPSRVACWWEFDRLAKKLDCRRRNTARRHRLEALPIVGAQDAERGLAQPHRLFQHRVEHRRKIARRGIDDLQHLGHRGLTGQRLVALNCPRVELAPKLSYDLIEINVRVVGHRLRLNLPVTREDTLTPLVLLARVHKRTGERPFFDPIRILLEERSTSRLLGPEGAVQLNRIIRRSAPASPEWRG